MHEDERSHVVRELHEELGAALTVSKLEISRACNKSDQSGEIVASLELCLELPVSSAQSSRTEENLGCWLAPKALSGRESGSAAIRNDVQFALGRRREDLLIIDWIGLA